MCDSLLTSQLDVKEGGRALRVPLRSIWKLLLRKCFCALSFFSHSKALLHSALASSVFLTSLLSFHD